MNARTFDISKFADAPFHRFSSVDELELTPPRQGISEVFNDTAPMHVYFKDRGYKVTIVYFSAALPREGWDTYPIFGGTSFVKSHRANILSISDPSFALPGRPSTGWSLGTSGFPLMDVIPRVITHFVGEAGSSILFGSSAGGFAALLYGAQLTNSVTVCANPRVDLMRLPTSLPTAIRSAFPGSTIWDIHESIPTSAAIAYRRHVGNTVAYIQNVSDAQYFEGGLLHFLGINGGNNKVFLNLVDSGVGHKVPDLGILHSVVRSLVEASPNWGNALTVTGYKQAPTVEFALRMQTKLLLNSAGD